MTGKPIQISYKSLIILLLNIELPMIVNNYLLYKSNKFVL